MDRFILPERFSPDQIDWIRTTSNESVRIGLAQRYALRNLSMSQAAAKLFEDEQNKGDSDIGNIMSIIAEGRKRAAIDETPAFMFKMQPDSRFGKLVLYKVRVDFPVSEIDQSDVIIGDFVDYYNNSPDSKSSAFTAADLAFSAEKYLEQQKLFT